jgi:hypothetical protein
MYPKIVVLHHSASPPSTTWEQLNQWHKDRGFTQSFLGWYIGYHWVIFPDGTKRQARLDTELGCHCVPNDNKLGICLVGDFTKTEPTVKQLETLQEFLRVIPYSEIYGHCELKATECPGSLFKWLKLYRRMGWLQEEIRKLVALLKGKKKENYSG